MHPATVLVTAPNLLPEAQQILREAGLEIAFLPEPVTEDSLAARLAAGPVAALIVRGTRPITARVLQVAPGLQVIAKNGAGIDGIDTVAAAQRGIPVVVAPGANADAVAEHALALMLALVRELPRLQRTMRGGGWEGTGWLGRDFRGSVVGIVGYGAIGRRTAQLAAALGARVVVHSRTRSEADGFALEPDLDRFLPQLDILSLHCPLTAHTRGLIGARELALLKPGALLVNTARGPIVDEAALLDALRSGHLGGAGLDTFDTEPLPADHPLRTLGNALLTPHVGGVTRQAALQVATITARNVVDALAGRLLPAAHLVPPPPGVLRPHADDPARWVADIPSPCVQAHAANLMVLGHGALGCVWFGGSMEGKSDISVYFSRLEPGAAQWSAPVRLSDDPDRSEQNPILFPAPDGTLWLLHTAQTSGHQDTAIVRRRLSHDDGRTWGPTETLAAAPAGTFVRQPVHVHTDGSWLLPIFRCRSLPGQAWDGSLDDSGVMRSTDQGRSWQHIDVPDSLGCVHMGIVPAAAPAPSGGPRLLGFFRSRWADAIHATHSDDGGMTWARPWATTLPNNNSSIQPLRLADGRLAMVFNASSAADATERRESLYDELDDAPPAAPGGSAPAAAPARRAFWGAPRAPMTLALSADDGRTWPWQRHLETGDGWCLSNDSARGLNREYSYPSLRQGPDGALHVAYTVFRRHIRHVRVLPDWITQSPQA